MPGAGPDARRASALPSCVAAAASPITGSIDVQADPPAEAQRANWLPVQKCSEFSPFLRAYWPKTPIIDGSWTPPAVMKAN
jgi:hypothetical protein